MILGYLLMGLLTAMTAAVTCLFLGQGLLMATLWYMLGGMTGMGLMLMLALLRRPVAALLPRKAPRFTQRA